jgi:hypothetical protein
MNSFCADTRLPKKLQRQNGIREKLLKKLCTKSCFQNVGKIDTITTLTAEVHLTKKVWTKIDLFVDTGRREKKFGKK